MLSRQQFFEKHKVKFRGLPRIEKDKRYQDYVSSTEAARLNPNPNGNEPRTPVKRAALDVRTVKSTNLSKLARYQNYSVFREVKKDMLRQYIASVLDPWSNKAHFPDPLAYHGVPVAIKFQVILKADDLGNLAMCLRDGIDRCIAASAYTGQSPASGTPTGYAGLIPRTAGSAYFRLQTANNPVVQANVINDALADATLDIRTAHSPLVGIQCSPWRPVASYADVKSTSTAYRTVSGGVELTYIGKPLEASGSLALAPYHASRIVTGKH